MKLAMMLIVAVALEQSLKAYKREWRNKKSVK